MGGNMLVNSGAKMEFTLLEDEQKVVDIDSSSDSTQAIASLNCLVLDDNGIPISGAELWIENGNGQVIEPMMKSSSGYYFISEPGSYVVHASYPGFKDVSMDVELQERDLQTIRTKDTPLFVWLEPEL